MLHAAEEAGVQFAVGQAVRFWPEYVKAKELYDSGALGTVKYARRQPPFRAPGMERVVPQA